MQMTSFPLIVLEFGVVMRWFDYCTRRLDYSRMSYSSSTMGVAGYETDIMKPETCQVFDIDKALCNNTLSITILGRCSVSRRWVGSVFCYICFTAKLHVHVLQCQQLEPLSRIDDCCSK